MHFFSIPNFIGLGTVDITIRNATESLRLPGSPELQRRGGEVQFLGDGSQAEPVLSCGLFFRLQGVDRCGHLPKNINTVITPYMNERYMLKSDWF